MNYSADIKILPRTFLPQNFSITDWENLEPYFIQLLETNITSKSELNCWLKNSSELEAVISEDACWRQIRMTCNIEDKKLEEALSFFMLHIQPKIQPYADLLNKKLLASPFVNELDISKFFTYLRSVKKNIDLFREANIPIQADLNILQLQFGIISGKMTVSIDEKEYTLQQAAKFLESDDRNVRASVYKKINDRRLQDKESLNKLYTSLIEKRHQVAINAGFLNYCDYKFSELGRFDYSKEDCFQFHDAVKQYVLPLVNEIYKRKKNRLNLDSLRPWDIEAHAADEKTLTPFLTEQELIEKTIHCFDKLHPFFGDCLRKMKTLERLDLSSRKGKAPGGYNCPLAESGAPFIFMNAAGKMDDLTTIVHEGGHAIHSFLTHPLELSAFKEYPMEIAEVASMAMELFSMDHWNLFLPSEEELIQAKEHQLERVITIFPWIATIDKFQHWVYENPNHTIEKRELMWLNILNEFTPDALDVSDLEEYRKNSWQKQLHLFEVPFYYIEYGIAQLGAIGLWMQFKTDKEKSLQNYCSALALGGTKTLPELFTAAGLNFNFSPNSVKTLMDFVHKELLLLQKQ
ncbi:MAG: M3 family oligoendopeptidase [Chitinophagaceae bacterium]|nr:MAG: M3 family oligoendopeptidase [Chitinophagaceae bacterium]